MLAGELALAGVDVADRFLAEGQKTQATGFAGVHFDLSGFPARHPYSLGLRQSHIERVLAGWIDELKVPLYRGIEVTRFVRDTSVDVELSDGRSLRAQYLVGCDRGRSLVRKAAGIAFPGSDPTTSNLIAEAEFAETPPDWGIRRYALGTHALGRVKYEIRNGEIVYADHGPVGVLLTEQHVGQTTEPTLSDLSAALITVYGTDYGIHSPTSIYRFTDAARQAASYRKGRVLIAGDAAHVHPPDGG
jgi:2-polyprenyl-6-methoxyphenol hydroxylase-like FAD-dependent oxidoreductase